MIAQLFVFKKHIPELSNYVKFGRDLYRHGILVVFCDTWQVPKEYRHELVQHLIIDIPVNQKQNC